MDEPKISVIIPTRERCDVLRHSLRTVLDQDYENLEIIVSDNFSNDATEEVVRDVGDARVRYLNTGRRLSMTHNWEYALSHVSDGWVTIIGDDDALLPGSLSKVANIIRSAGVKAIRSQVCSYIWPSVTGMDFGRLGVPLLSGCEVRDCRLWLTKVLNGRAGYPELPMLYQGGYVEMSVIEEIRRKSGSFYRSCVPDVYSAISIARAIDRYVYLRRPLAINGHSRHSTGASQFNGDKSPSSPVGKFLSEGNIPFHSDVPLCADGSYPPSLQALVYESYLQSQGVGVDASEKLHARQLEIILATERRHESSIREWGRIFAEQHDLNFAGISLKASAIKRFVQIDSTLSRMTKAISTYYAGSPKLPIRDVYEASLAAEAILNASPSRIYIFWQCVCRAAKKITQA